MRIRLFQHRGKLSYVYTAVCELLYCNEKGLSPKLNEIIHSKYRFLLISLLVE